MTNGDYDRETQGTWSLGGRAQRISAEQQLGSPLFPRVRLTGVREEGFSAAFRDLPEGGGDLSLFGLGVL